MQATIQKWGNSNAIRIPKTVLTTLGIKENDKVEISIGDDCFIVQKANHHISLAERLETFYNKPLDEIETISSKEIDWGDAVGEEEW